MRIPNVNNVFPSNKEYLSNNKSNSNNYSSSDNDLFLSNNESSSLELLPSRVNPSKQITPSKIIPKFPTEDTSIIEATTVETLSPIHLSFSPKDDQKSTISPNFLEYMKAIFDLNLIDNLDDSNEPSMMLQDNLVFYLQTFWD